MNDDINWLPSTSEEPAKEAGKDDEYEPVSDFSLEKVEMRKEMEQGVYDKVMSDLHHVVWAYGVIFALFAVYGVYLLRRGAKLRDDLDTLQRQLDTQRDKKS